MNGDPGGDAARPRLVDLPQWIRAITTGLILLSHACSLLARPLARTPWSR